MWQCRSCDLLNYAPNQSCQACFTAIDLDTKLILKKTEINREILDEYLVHGFIRNNHDQIPLDIMNLCLSWYHIKVSWEKCGRAGKLNDTKMTFIKELFGIVTCYASVIMPSISKINIDYEFRVKIIGREDEDIDLCIGIDDAKCENINQDAAGSSITKNYAYYCEGQQFNYKTGANLRDGLPFGKKYGNNDIITICYNPFKSVLSFAKNDTEAVVIEDVYGDENTQYRLFVTMYAGTSASVQLL